MENACFFLEACRDLTTPLSSHRVVPMCANVELNGCSRDENKRLFCAHTWEQLQIMICSHVTYTFISTRDKHVVVCPVMMLSYAAKMIYPLGRQLLRIPFFIITQCTLIFKQDAWMKSFYILYIANIVYSCFYRTTDYNLSNIEVICRVARSLNLKDTWSPQEMASHQPRLFIPPEDASPFHRDGGTCH